MSLAVELIGWAAALLMLGSYLFLSAGWLAGSSARFQWLNVFGAAGFVINSGWHGAFPSMVVNIIWCGIGLFALIRIWRARHRSAKR